MEYAVACHATPNHTLAFLAYPDVISTSRYSWKCFEYLQVPILYKIFASHCEPIKPIDHILNSNTNKPSQSCPECPAWSLAHLRNCTSLRSIPALRKVPSANRNTRCPRFVLSPPNEPGWTCRTRCPRSSIPKSRARGDVASIVNRSIVRSA